MKTKLFLPILLLLLSLTGTSFAQKPKYTHCIMIDKEDLCRQPWVQEYNTKDVHYKNTYSFNDIHLRHIIDTYKPINRKDDYHLRYYLSDEIDETFDASKVKSGKTKGCYIHIERQKDGKDMGTLILGIVEFEAGKKIVLQSGEYNYFTWHAAKL